MTNINWKYKVSEIATRVLSKRSTPLLVKEGVWKLVYLAAKTGRSNVLSFLARPIVTHKALRLAVGGSIAMLVIVASIGGPLPSLAGENTGGKFELSVVPEGEVNLATIEAVKVPLKGYTVTQSYWFAHPGIDMAAEVGTAITAVMPGKVIHTELGKYAYGNHVIIDHENGYTSLYGHMSKIEVVEGQEVTTETEVGKVGSTGHSTGPHLHLEVRDENGRATNPKTVLGIK